MMLTFKKKMTPVAKINTFDTHTACLSWILGGGSARWNHSETRAEGAAMISNVVSFHGAESKRILEVLTSAVESWGLDMARGTSAHSSLARTRHAAPPNTRAQAVRPFL